MAGLVLEFGAMIECLLAFKPSIHGQLFRPRRLASEMAKGSVERHHGLNAMKSLDIM